MAIKSDLNQTIFSERRPLYEQELHTLPPEPAIEIPDAEKPQPIFKRKIFWLILLPLFLILIIVLIAALNNGEITTTPEPEAEETPLVLENNDPLLRRIEQLEAELKEADPTRPKLVLPALKLDIALD